MTYSTDAKRKTIKSPSQSRKRGANATDNQRGISPMQRREMQAMLKELNQSHSWRWIARYTIGPARYAWLQRVADGKRDVRPRYQDLLMVRRLHDELEERADLDGRRLTLILELMELRAKEEQVITALVRMERA